MCAPALKEPRSGQCMLFRLQSRGSALIIPDVIAASLVAGAGIILLVNCLKKIIQQDCSHSMSVFVFLKIIKSESSEQNPALGEINTARVPPFCSVLCNWNSSLLTPASILQVP